MYLAIEQSQGIYHNVMSRCFTLGQSSTLYAINIESEKHTNDYLRLFCSISNIWSTDVYLLSLNLAYITLKHK